MTGFSSVKTWLSRLFLSQLTASSSASTRQETCQSCGKKPLPRKPRTERLLSKALAEAKDESKIYYLIYRTKQEQTPNWDRPTGWLVIPLNDLGVALSIGYQRYHVGPDEKLWFLEVRGYSKRALASFYHRQWERKMSEWLEACQR